MGDIRYALRSLARQPLFSLVAIFTLALGIGGSTAVFSLLYQALMRPLPYSAANRLVFIWNTYPLMGLPQASVSIPDYIDRKTGAPSIEDATLFTRRMVNLALDGPPQQLRSLAVTPSFFSTLGRTPAIGRAFTDADAQPGNDHYAILTHALWQSGFGGDQSIVGRSIRLNGEPYVVVGVLPSDFELPSQDIAVIVPFAFTPEQMVDSGRGNEFSSMIARLRDGATIERVNGEMAAIVKRNMERLPANFASFARSSGFGGYAVPIRDQLAGDTRPALYLLQAGVLVLLLIACANVASLLLMRATARFHELALRVTLGAGRARLLGLMIAEGLVLSAAGTIAGVFVAVAAVRGLTALGWQATARIEQAKLNTVVLGAAIMVAATTGVVFGLVPGLAFLRGRTAGALKEGGLRSSVGRRTAILRGMLVVGETALALMLLVSAGLLIDSYARIQRVDPGFTSANVLTAQISLPPNRYSDAPSRLAFWSSLVERVRAMPGVAAVALTSNVPFNGNVASGSYGIVGYTPPAGEAQPHGRQDVVGVDYFRTLQIPLVAGRTFTDADAPGARPVVVVDELLVRRYFAGRDPLGQQIRRGGPTSPPFTIVGVVGTVNSIDLGEPVTKERLYYPLAQQPLQNMGLIVKTAVAPSSIVAPLRAALAAIDPEQPLGDVRTLDQWMARSLEGRRSPMIVLIVFGAAAILLAAIGLHGVVAYSVAQRTREIGIRQALGADRRMVRRLVLSQGLRLATIGVVAGLAGQFVATRFLQSMLFGVGANDAIVPIGVALFLLGVAVAACDGPARRATAIDPAAALRLD